MSVLFRWKRRHVSRQFPLQIMFRRSQGGSSFSRRDKIFPKTFRAIRSEAAGQIRNRRQGVSGGTRPERSPAIVEIYESTANRPSNKLMRRELLKGTCRSNEVRILRCIVDRYTWDTVLVGENSTVDGRIMRNNININTRGN